MIIVGDKETLEYLRNRNLCHQYDLLYDCINLIIYKGINYFDKYMLWSLNHIALANIVDHAGRFREQPVYVNQHCPPYHKDVPHLMDLFFSWIYKSWNESNNLFIVPAYALWRLNWIHPFIDGNGRTARAICYLLICAKLNLILPGEKILPELLKENYEKLIPILENLDKFYDNNPLKGRKYLEDLSDLLAQLTYMQIKNSTKTYPLNSRDISA